VNRPRFERATSRIQVRCVIAWIWSKMVSWEGFGRKWSWRIRLAIQRRLNGENLTHASRAGKVVSVLYRAPRHEGVLGEWRYSSIHSLTSALDGNEWSASRPCRFIPREKAPGTHWIGGWLSPRVGLNAVVKRKIPSPRWESNPRTPIVQPVAQRYTDRSGRGPSHVKCWGV
jgi:hypothetical protein